MRAVIDASGNCKCLFDHVHFCMSQALMSLLEVYNWISKRHRPWLTGCKSVCLSLWPIPKCWLHFPAHPQTHPCTHACVHTYTYLSLALVCRSSIGERELVISLYASFMLGLYAREEPTTSIHFFPRKMRVPRTDQFYSLTGSFQKLRKTALSKDASRYAQDHVLLFCLCLALLSMSFSFVCSCVAITCLAPSRQPINAHICRCRPDDQGTRLWLESPHQTSTHWCCQWRLPVCLPLSGDGDGLLCTTQVAASMMECMIEYLWYNTFDTMPF